MGEQHAPAAVPGQTEVIEDLFGILPGSPTLFKVFV
jgi:hypothetical protein